MLCGSDSVVECHLAKVKVAGPNPVSRSTASQDAYRVHVDAISTIPDTQTQKIVRL